MLKVTPFTDIDAIKNLRQKNLGKGLDDYDSTAFHLALFEDKTLIGCARIRKNYKEKVLYIENVAIEKDYQNPLYYDFFRRSLVYKALEIEANLIVGESELESYYARLGFKNKDGIICAEKQDVVFPGDCGGVH